MIFLVRHAEKTDDGRDPELSLVGQMRSLELAKVLRDAGISRIYSTDYKRTRDTAAPIAKLLGLEVEIYDPRDLQSFARTLEQNGQRQLVVGHSNTTPELTALLGGEAGTEIDEPGEYDRLYVVTIDGNGDASSALLRYGDAFESP